MKVSIPWLKELVDFKMTLQDLVDQLSLRSIGIKALTNDHIELDLTYNRGDLLSLRGVAREVAAITGSEIKFEEKEGGQFVFNDKVIPELEVLVEDSTLCPIYCLVKIEDLSVKPSPKQWVKKLEDSGIRSINNLADITNLMMIEYGQPMHTFDAQKVKGQIGVRTAKDGEQLLTLDNKKRKLERQDLLITDGNGPIGLAGVMGGKNSEVSDSTTTILLEAAIFDPIANKKTSKRLGLHSEASKRFQHGLTKKGLFQALDEAVRTYLEHGGKMTRFVMVGKEDDLVKKVNLNQQKINSLIGTAIPSNQVESSLKSLGFHLKGEGGNSWEVTVPYWRLDINIEEDLIEEVARMYGYEKIEGIRLAEEEIPQIDQNLPKFIYDLKLKLKNLGLTEVQTYSFYSTAVLEALGFTIETKKHLIKIANPISSETEYLRLDLWPNLLEVVGKNIKQGFKDITIFEVGKNYFKNEEGQPQEKYRLAMALMNGTDNPIQELATLVQNLRPHLGGVKLNPTTAPQSVSNLFHPKRFINIEKEGEMIAGIAEVHLRLLNKLGIEKRIAITELNLQDLLDTSDVVSA